MGSSVEKQERTGMAEGCRQLGPGAWLLAGPEVSVFLLRNRGAGSCWQRPGVETWAEVRWPCPGACGRCPHTDTRAQMSQPALGAQRHEIGVNTRRALCDHRVGSSGLVFIEVTKAS